jgi:hypothetical protein
MLIEKGKRTVLDRTPFFRFGGSGSNEQQTLDSGAHTCAIILIIVVVLRFLDILCEDRQVTNCYFHLLRIGQIISAVSMLLLYTTCCARCELYVKRQRRGDHDRVPYYCELYSHPRCETYDLFYFGTLVKSRIYWRHSDVIAYAAY